MTGWVKKFLYALLIAFALYYLVTNPDGAAHAVRTFFGAFRSIGRFFQSLAG